MLIPGEMQAATQVQGLKNGQLHRIKTTAFVLVSYYYFTNLIRPGP